MGFAYFLSIVPRIEYLFQGKERPGQVGAYPSLVQITFRLPPQKQVF
jgi:hypothetical protein